VSHPDGLSSGAKGAIMKRLIASSLVTLLTAAGLAAAPALGQPDRKTELVEVDGRHVVSLQLRYDFEAPWVVDNQNILWRDTRRDYYLVTLKEACEPLDIRSLSFNFHPGWSWQLLTSRAYEVRPQSGAYCDVAKIEKVDDVRGNALRDAAQRRAW
jgi:hypothetical protein